jgi:hypothetical protein
LYTFTETFHKFKKKLHKLKASTLIEPFHKFKLVGNLQAFLYLTNLPRAFQFTCSVEDRCDHVGEQSCEGAECHRWCPLPHYIVLSCMIGYLSVAIFLRSVSHEF